MCNVPGSVACTFCTVWRCTSHAPLQGWNIDISYLFIYIVWLSEGKNQKEQSFELPSVLMVHLPKLCSRCPNTQLKPLAVPNCRFRHGKELLLRILVDRIIISCDDLCFVSAVSIFFVDVVVCSCLHFCTSVCCGPRGGAFTWVRPQTEMGVFCV
jgi:hypothetical protein